MSIINHYLNRDLFFKFIRSSELSLFFIHLLTSIIYLNKKSLFITIGIILNGLTNLILKNNISKPLFKLNNHSLLILGKGTRPDDAHDCGYFSNCPKRKAISYGMPSGHSQFAAFYSSFLIKDLIYKYSPDKKFNTLPRRYKISAMILLAYPLIMMYSRIYIEKCHTIEQTIIGAMIGFYFGIKWHNIYTKYNDNLNINSNKTRMILVILLFLVTTV